LAIETKWYNKNQNVSSIFPYTSHKTFSTDVTQSPPMTGLERIFLYTISENFMIGGLTVRPVSSVEQTHLPTRNFFVPDPVLSQDLEDRIFDSP